jgi:hydrogenase maturation protease
LNDKPANGNRPAVVPKTILFGIGNCGRADDGLGWAFVDRIQLETAFDGQTEYRYQLQVEDAALISSAERVIFIDSFKGRLADGFQWKPCEPSKHFEFTSHVLPPGAIMHYCLDLYGKSPRADLLIIEGTRWCLGVGMSPQAEHHLDKALQFFKENVLAPYPFQASF